MYKPSSWRQALYQSGALTGNQKNLDELVSQGSAAAAQEAYTSETAMASEDKRLAASESQFSRSLEQSANQFNRSLGQRNYEFDKSQPSYIDEALGLATKGISGYLTYAALTKPTTPIPSVNPTTGTSALAPNQYATAEEAMKAGGYMLDPDTGQATIYNYNAPAEAYKGSLQYKQPDTFATEASYNPQSALSSVPWTEPAKYAGTEAAELAAQGVEQFGSNYGLPALSQGLSNLSSLYSPYGYAMAAKGALQGLSYASNQPQNQVTNFITKLNDIGGGTFGSSNPRLEGGDKIWSPVEAGLENFGASDTGSPYFNQTSRLIHNPMEVAINKTSSMIQEVQPDYGGFFESVGSGIKDFGQAIWSGVSSIFGGSHLCTATSERLDLLSKEDKDNMLKLLRYSLDNHKGWTKFYLDEGVELVQKINKTEEANNIYTNFYDDIIKPCAKLVEEGNLEDAYEKYITKAKQMIAEYMPDVNIVEHYSMSKDDEKEQRVSA